MTTTPSNSAWPEGVIGRYLNLAGAAVDITETGPRDGEGLFVTIAACSGCPETNRSPWEDGFHDVRGVYNLLDRSEAVARAEKRARRWAQKHADECRAAARPAKHDQD